MTEILAWRQPCEHDEALDDAVAVAMKTPTIAAWVPSPIVLHGHYHSHDVHAPNLWAVPCSRLRRAQFGVTGYVPYSHVGPRG